jgi:hypothetical protein
MYIVIVATYEANHKSESYAIKLHQMINLISTRICKLGKKKGELFYDK